MAISLRDTIHGETPARRLLASALASLLLLACIVSAESVAALPSPPTAQERTVGVTLKAQERADGFTKLLAKANQTGDIPAIVGLAVPFAPEGDLPGKAAVDAQRARIATAQAQLEADLRVRKLKLKRKFKSAPIVATMLDAATLRAMETDPRVATVEEDSLSRPHLDSTSAIVGATVAHPLSFKGWGQTVAVLDSGVDDDHPFLHADADACFSTENFFIGADSLCPNDSDTQIGAGVGDNCATTIDGCDHGTHVAGIAAGRGNFPDDFIADDPDLPSFSGVAPGARVLGIQIGTRFEGATCTNAGDSSPCVRFMHSDIIAGLEHVHSLRNDFDIAAVNLSLGGGKYTNERDCINQNIGIGAAIQNLVSARIATVAATGNDSFTNALSSPACLPNVVSVGNTRDDDTVDASSNSADFLDLLAPGTNVDSSVPGNSFGRKTGTSMAAPQVAGAWALLKDAFGNLTVNDVLRRLQNSGVPVTDTRNSVTRSRIQVDAALGIKAVVVSAPAPSAVRTAGQSASFAIKIRRVNFTGAVNLVVEPPSGVTATVTPASPTGDSATLTVQTQIATSSLGMKTIRVKAAPIAGAEEFAATVVLDVRPPPSSVTGYSPTSGPAGTPVTINGTNLIGSTSVRFNGLAATSVTQISNTELRATVPAAATTGALQLTINGVASSPGNFAVTQEPSITQVTPGRGVAGDPVTITGFNFTGTTSVKFGATGTNATFTVASANQITTTVPTGAHNGHVTVTTPNGTALSPARFTINSTTAAPSISSFSPTQGDAGTLITIKGSGFVGSVRVDVGTGRAVQVTRISSLELQVRVPDNATTGPIKVTTSNGTATSAALFTRVLQ